MADIVDFVTLEQLRQHRPRDRGFFRLKDLPQSRSVSEIAVDTGRWELDQVWKPYPGQFTIVTGIPGHGKTTFLLNVICNLASRHGMRSFLYMPENEAHILERLALIWGDRNNFEKFIVDQCYIQSAMPEHYAEDAQDLPWVLNKAKAAIENHQIDLVVIDPWNELEFAKPVQMPMTEYVRICLMYLKQFCRAYKVAVILVAHPTKAVAENGGRIPLLSDIEGSMSWYNKCDNGLVVYRDFKSTKTCKVISAKVREVGAGKVGACEFYVDENTGVFTPQYGAVS